MIDSKRPPSQRVVITGIGVVSPIGNTAQDVWTALKTGKSGTGPITRFDPDGFATTIAAEVRDFDPRDRLGAKEARRTDRFVQFSVAAAQDALRSAELTLKGAVAERTGVLIGSAFGGLETAERELKVLNDKGPSRVSPFFIPMFLADMGAGYVSIVTGAKGPNFATLSACASGAHAIGEAAEMIRRGAADVMLAGGSEAAVTPGSVAGFNALGALSTRNAESATASRPFDATRDGFVVAEGAAMLVLERLDHALGRGAPILAELSGYGATADANHIVQPAPDGSGGTTAMQLAMTDAGWSPGDVDYINAHGTSTPLNDKLETLAIKNAFAEGAPPVSSTKALTGHLLGAAGSLEAVICVLGIQEQTMPATWHLANYDPDCDLDYVSGEPRPARLERVLSNSLGFGGHNVTLAVERFTDLSGA